MIVYVESNFVLELALLQEESASCEAILQLAESGAINLVMPAFSLGEPYETLMRRHGERRSLASKLESEFKQLRRSAPYAAALEKADTLTELLAASGREEATRLNPVLSRLLDVVTIVPTGGSVMRVAMAAQDGLDLGLQDSIVYAAVREHAALASGPKCFLNKNVKDFLIPQIEDEFVGYECKLLGKFEAGFAYVGAALAHRIPPGGPLDTGGA